MIYILAIAAYVLLGNGLVNMAESVMRSKMSVGERIIIVVVWPITLLRWSLSSEL